MIPSLQLNCAQYSIRNLQLNGTKNNRQIDMTVKDAVFEESVIPLLLASSTTIHNSRHRCRRHLRLRYRNQMLLAGGAWNAVWDGEEQISEYQVRASSSKYIWTRHSRSAIMLRPLASENFPPPICKSIANGDRRRAKHVGRHIPYCMQSNQSFQIKRFYIHYSRRSLSISPYIYNNNNNNNDNNEREKGAIRFNRREVVYFVILCISIKKNGTH